MSEEYGLTSVPDWAIRNSFTRVEDLEEALEKTNKTLDHVYLMAQHQMKRIDHLEEIMESLLANELDLKQKRRQEMFKEIQLIKDLQATQRQLKLTQPKK